MLNADHPLVQYLSAHKRAKNASTIAKQLYDLAKLQNAPLSAEEMSAFVRRSNDILLILADRHVDAEDVPEEEEKKDDKKADGPVEKVEGEEMPAEDAAAPKADDAKVQDAEVKDAGEEKKD